MWSRSIRPTSADIRSARHELGHVLRASGLGAAEPTATLLAGELLTNVVLHSRTDAALSASWDAMTLRVEVRDDDPTLPRPRSPRSLTPSGRGLRIVGTASDRWGVVPLADGKVVWFELDRHPASPSDAT
jgi:anti-sigma regulatory factor (Ser/Thr protein kinase)